MVDLILIINFLLSFPPASPSLPSPSSSPSFLTLSPSLPSLLLGRVSKLTQQCQEWRSTLATVQQARAQERTELQHLLGSKVSLSLSPPLSLSPSLSLSLSLSPSPSPPLSLPPSLPPPLPLSLSLSPSPSPSRPPSVELELHIECDHSEHTVRQNNILQLLAY